MNIAVALIITYLVTNFSTSSAVGGSFARCFTDEECAPRLQCLGTTDLASLAPCTDQDPYCVCIPSNALAELLCDQLEDSCSEGEICTEIPNSLVEQIQPFLSLQLQLCIHSSQTKFIQNLSNCQDGSQCPDQGECVEVRGASFCAASMSIDETDEDLPQATPETFPDPSLEASVPEETESIELPSDMEETEEPEEAVETFPDPSLEASVPEEIESIELPSDMEETEEPEEAVCIAAKYLDHMDQQQLLYSSHFLAKVLCDSQGSCATPGHMVLYKDRPMMMSSYCSHVACHPQLMHVNSPRYQHRLRIPSATDDLTFLAFAARHGTKTEEVLLRTAIRIGL